MFILSVDATPVNPEPDPTKLDAVTIPDKFKLPFESPIILSVALVSAI